MEISIKWNICRVCLHEENKSYKKDEEHSDFQLVHLFNENKKLPMQIFELSGVFMKPDDSLPDKICKKCLATLNKAVQFRKTCRSSNTYLQSVLERTKSASTLLKPGISVTQNNSASKTDDEIENNVNENNENVIDCNENSKGNTQTKQTLNSFQDQEDDITIELNDNMSNYTVELEEIIVMSDEDELYGEQKAVDEDNSRLMFEHITLQNNKKNSSLIKSELSPSQKLCENDNCSKQSNSAEEHYNASSNDSELVQRAKTDQVDYNNSDEHSNENKESVSEKYDEFVAIDEEENTESNIYECVIVDKEEKINDNEDQAQVSSTVDAGEKIEYCDEESIISDLSNDLDKECLKKECFSNCNISSTKAFEPPNEPQLNNRKSFQTTSGIKNPISFARCKMKRNLFKSAAYEPVQVCVCEICGNRFTNQQKMKLHMKIHLQYKNHQCELCFKRFITACNLQAHMRIHTGEKPFECKYCGRRFNDRSTHIRHERTHTNEKPFECFKCGKSFTLATTLQNHMKVHSNERSYRCEPCGKSFKLPHHLKKHQSTSLHRSVLKIKDDESN